MINILVRRNLMKKAFTLAEVLITLGIIGIVAALTIPMLISQYQKRVIETRLKEDFSIFSQVNKMMVANDVAFDGKIADGSSLLIKKWMETNMFPYMTLTNVCYGTKGCWSKGLQTTFLNKSTFESCTPDYGCGSGWVSFTMNNGTKVAMDVGSNWQLRDLFGIDSSAETCLKMYVDVNGDKKPNRIGIDVFLMTFTEDGFIPAGVSKTPQELKQNCNPKGYGTWCMTHVKNSGWKIPNDVWASRNK